LFVHDIQLVIDTPKDIIHSLNREHIPAVQSILFTHWHPDHTEGMRVVEEITSDWHEGALRNHQAPIQVLFSQDVRREMYGWSTLFGPLLDFYHAQNYIRERVIDHAITIGPLQIELHTICAQSHLHSDAVILSQEDKRVIYMPCEVKHTSEYAFLHEADLVFINNPYFETQEGVQDISEHHPLTEELFSMEQIVALIETFHIKKTVIVHIEEMWRLSYDEYRDIEQRYQDHHLTFAYDGMGCHV
jgi:phosphoribosyl 1,2-cyclic phosphate phosphodiesterase